MGRYYAGDIEGKFMFGIQSSDDASFFGGSESEPNHINYYFSKEDLIDIRNGIKTCIDELGKHKKKLDKFFKLNNSYDEKEIAKKLDIEVKEITPLLRWYARLELGKKIEKCVKKNGICEFEAEI